MCKVKRIVAIIMLTAIVFTATPLQQLVKLPVLVQHLAEHRQKDPSLTVAEFLMEHYLFEDNDEDTDTDYSRDMQLPFKSMALLASPALLCAAPLNPVQVIAAPEAVYIKKNVPLTENSNSAQYLSAIWQPPKSC